MVALSNGLLLRSATPRKLVDTIVNFGSAGDSDDAGTGVEEESEGGGMACRAAAFAMSFRSCISLGTEKSTYRKRMRGESLLVSISRVYWFTLNDLRSEYLRGTFFLEKTTGEAILTTFLVNTGLGDAQMVLCDCDEAARRGESIERDSILVGSEVDFAELR